MPSLQAGSGQILKTIVDAKGDLIVGTAADTVGRLAAGTNDYVLTAASGETTGLKWAAAAAGDVSTDAIWDAKGDLAVGTGSNTAARLAVGGANTFPMTDAGETTGLKWAAAPIAACGGRLTLTTGTPVTTADVTGATTVYFTPYSGSQFCGTIGLFDGTYWDILPFTELSLALTDYTASKPYDIWCYNNSGTPTLESTVWTDATNRATALTTQDGIYVKTGATTRRYLGTIYINSSGGQTDDSVAKRNVFNYYNRVLRRTYRADSTSHNYTTGAWRSWNNDATLRIEVMVGVVENPSLVSITAFLETCLVSVGYDATNAELEVKLRASLLSTTTNQSLGTQYSHYPSAGWHWYQAIEYGAAGATQSDIYISADVFA